MPLRASVQQPDISMKNYLSISCKAYVHTEFLLDMLINCTWIPSQIFFMSIMENFCMKEDLVSSNLSTFSPYFAAIVALMIPILMDYSRRRGLNPKQLLLPLSYAFLLWWGGRTVAGLKEGLQVAAAIFWAHLCVWRVADRPYGASRLQASKPHRCKSVAWLRLQVV
eukprot:1151441-Pelagomonas_calceolata.AAC.5